MPASFGLKCPHLHCTRVHNKRPQTPTSPCARAQLKIRASKRTPASPRAWKDTRVGLLAGVQEMLASAFPCVRQRNGRVYIDACKDARVACYLSAKDACVRGSYRDRDLVSLPPSFKPRSLHDQEQREEGVWL